MGLLIPAFLIVLAIFIVFFVVRLSLDDTKVYMSKIARVILIVMILMACYISFNYCHFFHDGFC